MRKVEFNGNFFYYPQLGKNGNTDDDKNQAGRVFMLRTTKRVLKVPHSVHSNVETPRPIAGLNFPPPLPPQRHGNFNEDILKVFFLYRQFMKQNQQNLFGTLLLVTK